MDNLKKTAAVVKIIIEVIVTGCLPLIQSLLLLLLLLLLPEIFMSANTSICGNVTFKTTTAVKLALYLRSLTVVDMLCTCSDHHSFP